MTTVTSNDSVSETALDSSGIDLAAALPEPDECCEPRISRRQLCRLGVQALTVAAIGGTGYTAWSARLETTRQTVNLGISRPLRVVGVSDLHLDADRSKYFEVVERIRRERPDLVVIVGDTLDHRKGSDVTRINEVISAIDAPMGKIATLGNWDRDSVDDIDALRGEFEAAGARLLVNETCEIAGLRIVGVDDMVRGNPDLRLAREEIAKAPTLVLSHCPAFYDSVLEATPTAEDRRFLMISGHTHGGQVAPFGIALFTPSSSGRYVAGAYGDEGRSLYVMRGIGTSGFPWRVGAKPEISVFEIS
jgi:predicted MPP superfamily phosphohydrolase